VDITTFLKKLYVDNLRLYMTQPCMYPHSRKIARRFPVDRIKEST